MYLVKMGCEMLVPASVDTVSAHLAKCEECRAAVAHRLRYRLWDFWGGGEAERAAQK